jgi:hypothetical protein
MTYIIDNQMHKRKINELLFYLLCEKHFYLNTKPYINPFNKTTHYETSNYNSSGFWIFWLLM